MNMEMNQVDSMIIEINRVKVSQIDERKPFLKKDYKFLGQHK